MLCAVETCNDRARYSVNGLCTLHNDRYRERVGIFGDRSRFNVPGSRTYDPSLPRDYQVQSIANPTAVAFDGFTYSLSDGGTYGLAIDDGGYYYPTTDPDLIQYYIKLDDDAVPYIIDAQEIS